jgi:DNA polymerase-3 subunit delta'
MEGIVGQEHAQRVLETALRGGRLHHAYIFHGPAGVGKFTTALVWARLLLCQQLNAPSAGPLRPCGRCPSCARFVAAADGQAAHPDLHVVTKELALFSDDAATRERKLMNIPVRVLEDYLLDPVYRHAHLGHAKVFIVDEAELIDPVGQNKLLKTLEEPPEGTVIILVTANPQRLLPTIRSRCQPVAFVPLAVSILEADLSAAAPKLTAAERGWLIEFADGSLGRARLAVDYGLTEWAATLHGALDEMARGRLPVELGRQIQQWIDAFATRWVDQHDNASKDAANKLGAALVWSMLARQARTRLAQALASPAPAAAQPWLAMIDALTDAERELGANVNLGLVCDHLVLTLARALGPGAASPA